MAQKDQHSLPARLAILDEQNARKIDLHHPAARKRLRLITNKKSSFLNRPSLSNCYLFLRAESN
jgi:hypothetical protein